MVGKVTVKRSGYDPELGRQVKDPTLEPRLTKAQRTSLRWAKRKYSNGEVPPFVFRDYRSVDRLLKAGLIEFWLGYGAPMYRFTPLGLRVLEED